MKKERKLQEYYEELVNPIQREGPKIFKEKIDNGHREKDIGGERLPYISSEKLFSEE